MLEQQPKATSDNQLALPCDQDLAAAPYPCHRSSNQASSTGSIVFFWSSSWLSSAPPSHQLSIPASMDNRQHYMPCHSVVKQLNCQVVGGAVAANEIVEPTTFRLGSHCRFFYSAAFRGSKTAWKPYLIPHETHWCEPSRRQPIRFTQPRWWIPSHHNSSKKRHPCLHM